jgi:hypothetical protein
MFATAHRLARAVRGKFRRKSEEEQSREYFESAQSLTNTRNIYEELRREFIQQHPRLAWFAPPPLRETPLSLEAEAAAKLAEGTDEEKQRLLDELVIPPPPSAWRGRVFRR